MGVFLFGCAEKKPLKAQLTIPRSCITDVHLTDDTKCVYDEKDKKWHCSPLVIDKLHGCEQVLVIPNQKENQK